MIEPYQLGRSVPTFDSETVEVWMVPDPASTIDTAVAVELRIVGARGGIKASAVMSGFGSSKLASLCGQAAPIADAS